MTRYKVSEMANQISNDYVKKCAHNAVWNFAHPVNIIFPEDNAARP